VVAFLWGGRDDYTQKVVCLFLLMKSDGGGGVVSSGSSRGVVALRGRPPLCCSLIGSRRGS